MRGQSYHPVGGELVHEQVLHDEEGGEQLLQLYGEGGGQLLPLDVENPGGVLAGGVLADGLDKYGADLLLQFLHRSEAKESPFVLKLISITIQ